MNSGIKLSTFAVAGLLSVGASALTFDESAAPGGDFNAAMGIEESVGTLNLGTNTVTGSLLSTDMGGANETDPFEFTVADGQQVDSITFTISNFSFDGPDPASPDADTADDKTFTFTVVADDAGMGAESLVPTSGLEPAVTMGGMGATANECAAGGGMGAVAGCQLLAGGMASTLAMGTTLTFVDDGNVDLTFPLDAGTYDFLNSVVSLTGMGDGIETLGALVSYDWLVEIEVSAVPLPAAAWLFVSALAGLFGFRKAFSSEAA